MDQLLNKISNIGIDINSETAVQIAEIWSRTEITTSLIIAGFFSVMIVVVIVVAVVSNS